nr:hypothetical protein [Paraburkholderia flagellata]
MSAKSSRKLFAAANAPHIGSVLGVEWSGRRYDNEALLAQGRRDVRDSPKIFSAFTITESKVRVEPGSEQCLHQARSRDDEIFAFE